MVHSIYINEFNNFKKYRLPGPEQIRERFCKRRLPVAWEKRLVELVAFEAMPGHGHCRVPKRYPANPQLGAWVGKQREQKKKYDADPTASALTAEWVAKLEALGFAWDPKGLRLPNHKKAKSHRKAKALVG